MRSMPGPHGKRIKPEQTSEENTGFKAYKRSKRGATGEAEGKADLQSGTVLASLQYAVSLTAGVKALASAGRFERAQTSRSQFSFSYSPEITPKCLLCLAFKQVMGKRVRRHHATSQSLKL